MNRVRTTAAGLALAVGLPLATLSCSGGDGSSGGTTTLAVTEADPIAQAAETRIWYDPAQPIEAAVGERFTIILGADPAAGGHWVLAQPVDPSILVALGTTFTDLDDPVIVGATTTTAPPPPPETEPEAATPTTAPESTTTLPAETTTTTAPPPPPPSWQLLTFVARSPGTTAIVVRYEQVGADPATAGEPLTFTVTVPDPNAPPPTEAPAEDGAAPA